MNDTKRIDYLDYVKAMCVFMVLIAHRELRTEGLGAFCIPAFFLLAGYTFSVMQDNFKKFAVKKIKRLLFPYWVTMLIYGFEEVIRSKLFGYENIKVFAITIITTIYGSSANFPKQGMLGQYFLEIVPFNNIENINLILPTNGHLWFLPAMFSANILFYFVVKYRKPSWLTDLAIICLLLLLAGIETIPHMIQLPYGLGRGFFGAAIMLVGYILKEKEFLNNTKIKYQIIGLLLTVPISILSIIFGYACDGMMLSYYGPHIIWSVFISFACGVSFTYVVILICKFIKYLPLKHVHRFLSMTGKNSMIIYLLHMVIFFLCDSFMIFVLKTKTYPDWCFTEMFNGHHYFYRGFVVLLAFSLLGFVGNILKKKRIK